MKIMMDAGSLDSVSRAFRGTAKDIAKAQMRAVNKAAQKTRTAGSKGVRDQVKLSASYVNQSLTVARKATTQRPEAIIGARQRPTRLARFGAKQLTRQARVASSGDSTRGISAGRRQAGVSVAVKKSGGRKKMRGAFLIPLKSSGKMGVFLRTGKGRKNIEHQYGPSVDQVFGDVREDVAPDAQKLMQKEYRRQLDRSFKRRARR